MPTSREINLYYLSRIVEFRLRQLCRRRLGRLVKLLEHIRDPVMRGRAFLEKISREPPLVTLEMLHSLEIMARRRHPAAQKLFLQLLDEQLVADFFNGDEISEIWRLGRLRGYQKILEAFFYTSGFDSRLNETPRLPPDIRDIPLGRRRSMARTGIITVLDRLLLDNDVAVIRNLLANPRLTETEVVRLAARTPNTSAILSLVASHRRWISRYAVKKALVYNPYTPISISAPLLRFLLREDLVELSRRSSVNCILRRSAGRLLEELKEDEPPFLSRKPT